MWIVIEALEGALELTPFQKLYQESPGVSLEQPKVLKIGQAARLLGRSAQASPSSAPIVEFSETQFCVYLNWSDNLECQAYHLTRAILDHNQCRARCYDGYDHRDNKAIEKWMEFAALRDI